MMDAFNVLIKNIDERAEYLQQAVASGRAATFEEYKGTCGEIKGLLVARGMILDLKQTMEQSDDE
jgi:hypothetical protein